MGKLGKILTIVFVILAVNACTQVYLASVPKLRQIDPMSMDFNEVYGAMKTSKGVFVQALPEFVFAVQNLTTGKTKTRRFPLETVKSGLIYQNFINENEEDGFQYHVYKFSNETIAALEEFRSESTDAKARGEKQKGTVRIELSNYCVTEDVAARAKAQAFLRTGEIGTFIPVTRSLDIEKVYGQDNAELSICESS